MGFHLRDKNHVAVVRDRHVGGLTGLFHQGPQHWSPGLHHLDAACERTTDAEGFDPNGPKLAVLVELDIAKILQSHQQPVRC